MLLIIELNWIKLWIVQKLKTGQYFILLILLDYDWILSIDVEWIVIVKLKEIMSNGLSLTVHLNKNIESFW